MLREFYPAAVLAFDDLVGHTRRLGTTVVNWRWVAVGVAGLLVAMAIAVALVLWYRHRQTMKQRSFPQFRPSDERSIRWDNTHRHELDAEATTRLPPIPTVAEVNPVSGKKSRGSESRNKGRTGTG